MKQNIGFIGAGNMATSLIGGMIESGFTHDSIKAAEPDAEQRKKAAQLGIEILSDNDSVAQWADILIFAVKPQLLQQVVEKITTVLKTRQPLLVSIAAGIRVDTISRWADANIGIVRVMPNTPALVMQGMSALYANSRASEDHKMLVQSVFKTVGDTLWLDSENDMDAVTAVSGSGPAYFFLLMEAMINAARQQGIDETTARQLVVKTALGASTMASNTLNSPAELRAQVTSPGGTTEQGIKVFQQGGLEKLTADAIDAATQRSIQLSKQFDEGS